MISRATVIAVGKLKESYLREACVEYAKRLSGFLQLNILEIEETRLPDNPSPAQIAAGLQDEGSRIQKAIPTGCIAVALCIEGQELSSPALSQTLDRMAVNGHGQVAFLIGGSFGLAPEVKAAAALRLSMSPMTFPHQLARVMLLEQLYRAAQISAGGKYHK